MPYNSNNFQHIEDFLRTPVDDLVLHISLKFQVNRIKIVWVLLLAELKNAVLRKICLKVQIPSTCSLRLSTRNAVTLEIKYLNTERTREILDHGNLRWFYFSATHAFRGAPKFRNWSTTLEIKNDSSAIGTIRYDIHKRSKEAPLPSREPFVPNEDENTKYKKSLFLH